MAENTSELELIAFRQAKVAELRQKGVNPFATHAEPTHKAAQVIAHFDDLLSNSEVVSVAGRIRSLRPHGGSAFAHLEDGSGRIQIYLKSDTIGQAQYAIFELCDIGDFIAAQGKLFLTKTGEKTILVDKLTFLSKSLRPLPGEWYGLKDVELRYRKRYLDFLLNPDVKRKLIVRSQILNTIRNFLTERDFVEIENPMLEQTASGALAKPFQTHINAYDMDLYLRISLELWQKMSLVGGFDKVFDMGRAFRNEGVDFQHNPEFTLLEYYWAYGTLEANMQLHEELFARLAKTIFGKTEITYQGQTINLTPPYPRKTFRQAILDESGIDIESFTSVDELKAKLRELKIEFQDGMSRAKLLDELYKSTARPKLIQPVFITAYPAELKPLAKKIEGNEQYVDIFQLLIAGMEVSNSYNELNDPIDQRERFAEQARMNEEGDEEAMPIDENFLEAMEYGMPPATGTGIGIDRLTMLFTDSHHLREVIAYPLMKPHQPTLPPTNQPAKNESSKNTKTQTLAPHTPLAQAAHYVNLTREDAWAILQTMTQSDSLRKHALAVEAAMRYYARLNQEDEELWGIAGLLHDADYETHPDQHPGIIIEHLDKMQANPMIAQAIACHGSVFGLPQITPMDKTLFAVDELSGFIVAVTYVRPDKQLASVEVKSVLKKLKDKAFARNVSREDIQTGAELLNLALEEHIQNVLNALRTVAPQLGL